MTLRDTPVVAPPRFAATPEQGGLATATRVGLAALTFSALYLVSDIVEAIQGGFSTGQLFIRAEVFPAWTGAALMAGVVLVSASQTLPETLQVLAAAVRDLGFAGMGAALIAAVAPRRRRGRR
jgi:hypothetical protein